MNNTEFLNRSALVRVADYARLSEDDEKDPEKRGENVGIQLDECAYFREQHADWQCVGSFKDNDRTASAYGDAAREDFEKLMALVRASDVDIILCVEVTRLFRKPLEAETLIDLVWTKRTSFHTVVTTRGGYYDLRTSAGRKAVRDAVNAAAGESDNISDRVRVKKAAMARKGMPNGGRRPYGFEPDQITHRAQEVSMMREIAGRVIKGESTRHIFAELNDRGVPTAEGCKWTNNTMTGMLRRKRYAEYGATGKGTRIHNGLEYQAVWDAVYDTATWEKLQVALMARDHLAAQRGNARKYVLTGYVYCGKCGAKLGGTMQRDRPTQPKKARYKCKQYNIYGQLSGCSGVSCLADPLEDLVMSTVLFRLDSPEFAQVLAETENDSTPLRAALELSQIHKQKLDALIDDYYGDNPDRLTREQFLRAKSAAEASLAEAGRQVERYSAKNTVLTIPIGQTLIEAYNSHLDDLGWLRQLLSLSIDKIILHPLGVSKPRYEFILKDGACRFDPNRVEMQFSV